MEKDKSIFNDYFGHLLKQNYSDFGEEYLGEVEFNDRDLPHYQSKIYLIENLNYIFDPKSNNGYSVSDFFTKNFKQKLKEIKLVNPYRIGHLEEDMNIPKTIDNDPNVWDIFGSHCVSEHTIWKLFFYHSIWDYSLTDDLVEDLHRIINCKEKDHLNNLWNQLFSYSESQHSHFDKEKDMYPIRSYCDLDQSLQKGHIEMFEIDYYRSKYDLDDYIPILIQREEKNGGKKSVSNREFESQKV